MSVEEARKAVYAAETEWYDAAREAEEPDEDAVEARLDELADAKRAFDLAITALIEAVRREQDAMAVAIDYGERRCWCGLRESEPEHSGSIVLRPGTDGLGEMPSLPHPFEWGKDTHALIEAVRHDGEAARMHAEALTALGWTEDTTEERTWHMLVNAIWENRAELEQLVPLAHTLDAICGENPRGVRDAHLEAVRRVRLALLGGRE